MPDNLPSAGFHYGVPFEVYRGWDAANVSTIKGMNRTAKHCKWDMEHPKHSEEMDVGSAVHVAILEPARFDQQFFLAPEFDARTKEGKETKAQAETAAAGRILLRPADGDYAAKEIAASVWGHKGARRLLQMPGQCEVCALWRDEESGLMCKGRFDKLIPSAAWKGKRPIIVELKTTRDAREWQFGKDALNLGYAAQASYYSHAVKLLTGEAPIHVIIAMENYGPWAVAAWSLDDEALQTGMLQWRKWLNDFAKAKASGQWPGYAEEVKVLRLPAWATKETEEA